MYAWSVLYTVHFLEHSSFVLCFHQVDSELRQSPVCVCGFSCFYYANHCIRGRLHIGAKGVS